jgi:hypothetical protein
MKSVLFPERGMVLLQAKKEQNDYLRVLEKMHRGGYPGEV